MDNNQRYKKMLKYLIISLILCIIFINSMIISIQDTHYRHTVMIVVLNIAASIATTMGFITIYRHGISGSHGKSYLFITIGISLWFCADLYTMYSYFIMGIDEDLQISISDALWLTGYLFLSLHLISVIQSIGIKSLPKTVSILSMIVVGFIIANLIGTSYFFANNGQTKDVVIGDKDINLLVTILYPILDLSLIVPSVIGTVKHIQRISAFCLLDSFIIIIIDKCYSR